jgi:hypothetical protein
MITLRVAIATAQDNKVKSLGIELDKYSKISISAMSVDPVSRYSCKLKETVM